MIVKLLVDLLYSVFSILTLPINIPDLPSEVNNIVQSALEYIGMGVGLLNNYTHLSYLLVLLGIVVGVDAGIWIYKLVMYIIKKIPMLNVS